MNQPYAPGSTYQIAQQTGFRATERYEVIQEETRTNTTIFAPSAQLVAPIGPGETFIWYAVLVFGGNSAGNAKYEFLTPASPTSGGIYGQGTDATATNYVTSGGLALYNTGFATANTATANAEWLQIIWGRLVNGTNGGEFTVSWAQNGANMTASKLLIGSYLEVARR